MGRSLSDRSVRFLLIWRYVCGVTLGILSVLFFVVKGELGPEPGWYLLLLGVAPTIIVVIVSRLRNKFCVLCALVHDASLFCLLAVLLLALPNYLALVALSPLAVFLIEGLFLWVLLGINGTQRQAR